MSSIVGVGYIVNGKSRRATQQVNKWNREEGFDKYDSRIVREFPGILNNIGVGKWFQKRRVGQRGVYLDCFFGE